LKRVHGLILGSAAALFLLSLLHPAAALAQTLPGDPTALFTSMGMGWFQQLQGMAARLYGGLFTIEVIVVCVQGALYKDNIAEFFQGFAFKILTATVMLAIIGNAGTIFPAVVGMFETTAAQVTGNTGSSGNVCFQNANPAADQTSSAQCTANTISNPTGLELNMLGWAAMYFVAADVSRAADSAEGAIAGIVVFGTGVPGLSTAFLMGHENFSLFCIAMGMTCVMSAAGLLLTYVLLTFETQVIMSIGVIFLAFQGSRFTAQFSQGYMSYCINIGTKFFVFYFMVSILGAMMQQGNAALGASIAGLIAGAAIPFGAGSIALVAASSPIPIICVITSVLIAAIPNFASSLLSGASALSASSALQSGAVGAMAGGIGGGMSSLGGAAMGGAAKSMQGSGSQGPVRPDTSTGAAKTGSAPTLGPTGGPNGAPGGTGATTTPQSANGVPSEGETSGTATGPGGSLYNGSPGSTGATSTPQNGAYGSPGAETDALVADEMVASQLGPAEPAWDENEAYQSPAAATPVDGDDERDGDDEDDDDSDARDPDNMDIQGEREQEEQDEIDQEVADREAERDGALAVAGLSAGGAMMGASGSVPPSTAVTSTSGTSGSSGTPVSSGSGAPGQTAGPPRVAATTTGTSGQTIGTSAPSGATPGQSAGTAGPPRPSATTTGQTAGTSGTMGATPGHSAGTSGTSGTMGATPGQSVGTTGSGGGMGATPTPAPRASDDESTKSLKGVPTEQIASMSDAEFKARMENTSFTDLNKNQIDYIKHDADKSKVAADTFKSQAVNNFTDQLTKSGQGIDWAKEAEKAAPKGELPPQAVQVRVTNPDKL
jgi:hypothetical protein